MFHGEWQAWPGNSLSFAHHPAATALFRLQTLTALAAFRHADARKKLWGVLEQAVPDARL